MTSLEVLTLNCWALKPVSKFRAQRIDAIARNLASSTQYDIVCLQELWLVQDYDIVCKAVRHSLPYTKFFFTGALGSGLAIFSKHPLLSSLTIPYHLTGRPLGFGDFFVNKSAGSVVIEHPSLGEIEIFTTHMHAGGPEGYELGNSYRSTQAWRLSNEMRRAASQGRYVVTCGDFNFEDHELPYSILRDHGLVEDAWLASRVGLRPAVIPSETPELAVTEAGMTVDSPLNTWTHGKNIPLEVQRKFGKRLDYIFTRAPSPPSRWASYLRSSSSKDSSAPLSPALVCTEAEVVMRQLVPGEIYSISDHFGLRAKFILEDATGSSSTSRNDTEQPRTLVSTNDSSTASSDGSSTSSSTPLREMRSLSQTQHTLTSLFTLVQHHRAVHTKHFKQLLIIFPSGILLFLALTTSSAFIPDRASFSPIFVFFSGLVGFATCVALIVGFVWGRWEEGGLKRVEAELEEELNRLSRTRL